MPLWQRMKVEGSERHRNKAKSKKDGSFTRKKKLFFQKKVGGREAEERMPFIYMQLWLSGREKKKKAREREF